MFYSPFEQTSNDLSKMKQSLEAEKLFFSEELTCKCCKTRLSDFLETGYVGCVECYKIFNKEMLESLYNFHKAVRHTGKRPACVDNKAKIKQEIDRLIKLQAEASANEEYLLAQEYKEKIASLRGES